MQSESEGTIQDPEETCQFLAWRKKQGQVSGSLGTLRSGILLILPKSKKRIFNTEDGRRRGTKGRIQCSELVPLTRPFFQARAER